MKPNKVEVATRIKEIRSELNLTILEFGAKIGVSKATAYSWMRGIALPPKEKIRRIAFLADTTSDWILWGHDLEHMKEKSYDSAEEGFDIAKQIEILQYSLKNNEHITFYGNLLSDNSRETLIDTLEFALHLTNKMSK